MVGWLFFYILNWIYQHLHNSQKAKTEYLLTFVIWWRSIPPIVHIIFILKRIVLIAIISLRLLMLQTEDILLPPSTARQEEMEELYIWGEISRRSFNAQEKTTWSMIDSIFSFQISASWMLKAAIWNKIMINMNNFLQYLDLRVFGSLFGGKEIWGALKIKKKVLFRRSKWTSVNRETNKPDRNCPRREGT